MKDNTMEERTPIKEMSEQQVEEEAFRLYDRLDRVLDRGIALACNGAAVRAPGAQEANAFLSDAKGALWTSRGAAVKAGNALPDVTLNFGGK